MRTPERDLLIVVNDAALRLGMAVVKELTADQACDAAIITTATELARVAAGPTHYRLALVVAGNDAQETASMQRVLEAQVAHAHMYVGPPIDAGSEVRVLLTPVEPQAIAAQVREALQTRPRHQPPALRASALRRFSSSIELHGDAGTQRIPKKIGDYRIERQLGVGGMGAVYLGVHETLDIPVAIKLLMPGADARDVMRFYREARLAARLDHPCIVRVLGAGEWEQTHYIAMQFIEGDSARTVLDQNGPMPADRGAFLLEQALSALSHAHGRHCIHRDLKPDNLMITPDGDIKITDFGLARSTGADDMRLTQPGKVLGTPEYMPVEQWHGETVDHRADLYSLGATFYVILTGEMPFEGKTHSELVRNVMAGNFTPLAKRRPDLPRALARTVEALLQRDANRRPQSAQAASAILHGESAPAR